MRLKNTYKQPKPRRPDRFTKYLAMGLRGFEVARVTRAKLSLHNPSVGMLRVRITLGRVIDHEAIRELDKTKPIPFPEEEEPRTFFLIDPEQSDEEIAAMIAAIPTPKPTEPPS